MQATCYSYKNNLVLFICSNLHNALTMKKSIQICIPSQRAFYRTFSQNSDKTKLFHLIFNQNTVYMYFVYGDVEVEIHKSNICPQIQKLVLLILKFKNFCWPLVLCKLFTSINIVICIHVCTCSYVQ